MRRMQPAKVKGLQLRIAKGPSRESRTAETSTTRILRLVSGHMFFVTSMRGALAVGMEAFCDRVVVSDVPGSLTANGFAQRLAW